MAALTQAYDWFNIMDYDYHGGWENFTGKERLYNLFIFYILIS